MTSTLKNRLAARTDSKDSALVTAGANYTALNVNALNVIRENLKNQPLSPQLFDIVKSPSGGSTVFSVPGISGEEAEKSLTGIILDYTTPRAYWDTPDPVEGTPPVCFSENSLVSHDGKSCRDCPYNDFGSKDGESNAKACKESVVLYLLRQDNVMPLLVRVPVSSKFIFQKYVTRLVGKMVPLNSVVTKISLEKKVSRSGQTYASYVFEAVCELSPEQSELAREYSRQFMTALAAAEESTAREVS